MASRYWVGGTGTWDSTTTTNWSATSGGAGGASVPTSSDNVFFNTASSATSYSVTISTAASLPCLSLSISGPASGTLTYGSASKIVAVSGTLTIAATGVTASAGYFFMLAATPNTITTNNVPIDTIELRGSTTYTLGTAFTGKVYIGTTSSTTTFDTGNFNVTCSASTSGILGNTGSTSTFTGGTSTITFSGISSTFSAANITTVNASSCTFNFTGTNTVLAGNGKTYGTVNNGGASRTFTISGSNTIATLANTVQPTTFKFTSGTTQTVTNFNVSGTSGNLVTIQASTAGTAATLSKSSGTVSSDYLSIQDSTATGGASWYAGANSTNVSGNTGWVFTAAPSASASNFFFLMQ